MPDHVKVSTNKSLFEHLRKAYGHEVAMQTSLISNQQPMLTVRANTMRTTRQDLMKKFNSLGWEVRATKFAPNGIRFVAPPQGNLFSLVEFKKGHFEVQDEASQLLAMRVDCKPK